MFRFKAQLSSDSSGKAGAKGKDSIVDEFKKLLVLLAFVVFIRSSILGLYVIPTGSMLPTIKRNDRIIANKLAYGLMLPFAETQIASWAKPERGDIVLFKSPKEDNTFVKRVIGIEGDKINFRDGVLVINDTPVVEAKQSDRSILDDMGDNGDDKTLYLESSSELASHYMLRSTVGGPTFFESQIWNVPAGKILCIGDNRDGSNDGRYWGYVDVDKVYGKALWVFFSTIPDLPGILPTFRTDRFFTPLR